MAWSIPQARPTRTDVLIETPAIYKKMTQAAFCSKYLPTTPLLRTQHASTAAEAQSTSAQFHQ
jgi:hypothetical protein